MNVIIISFRRSGTHLTIDSIINNFSYFDREYVTIDQLCKKNLTAQEKEKIKQKISKGNNVIKSHFLPEFNRYCHDPEMYEFVKTTFNEAKKIYVIRHGLDVMVSLYHYIKKFKPKVSEISFRDFLNYTAWPPEAENQPLMSFWAKHLDQWEKTLKNNESLFIQYEDLLNNYHSVINQISQFIGIDTNKHIKDLRLKNVSPIKKKILNLLNLLGIYKYGLTSVSYRKGVAGDYKNYFDEEMVNSIPFSVQEKLKQYNYSADIK
jgi:hypothetical protein